MKKILYILMALMCISCGEKPTPPNPGPDPGPGPVPPVVDPVETLASKIAKEWHCVVSDIDADIYLSLGDSYTFELYQKIGEERTAFIKAHGNLTKTQPCFPESTTTELYGAADTR